ncbi:hypothetical protein [Janthinobacterium sp. B9-8]|uniref:hypothetical protein n=1 Tax=Janthinobacterium sp. B9-8 TaxID=1236179 RepID=UPI00069C6C65|nr:hypothetical protein [Janthinobacterium sp. B9-8]AMC35765.1 hypothetical protein VN23_14675 [Janthinobacterium sp. B9-8]
MKWPYLIAAVTLIALGAYSQWPTEAQSAPAAVAAGSPPSSFPSRPSASTPWLATASAVGSANTQSDSDQNHDGVPDDVNAYIDQTYASSKTNQLAFTQLAQGWGEAINDISTSAQAKQAGEKIARGIACLMSDDVTQKTGKTAQTMYDELLKTRAEMLGTPKRTEAYLRFQTLASGQYFTDPGNQPCNFKPAELSS